MTEIQASTTNEVAMVAGRSKKRKETATKTNLKRPMNGYQVYCNKIRPELVKKCGKLGFEEMSKECSKTWKNLTFEGKKPYLAEAEQLKTIYCQQKKEMIEEGTYIKTTKNKKRKGDDVKQTKPKRAVSAYILYCKETRNEIKKKSPDMPFSEIGITLGKMWKTLPEDQKAKFKKLAEEDKLRYDKEKKHLQED